MLVGLFAAVLEHACLTVNVYGVSSVRPVTTHVVVVTLLEEQLPDGAPVTMYDENWQSPNAAATQLKVTVVVVLLDEVSPVGFAAPAMVPPVTVMVPFIAESEMLL
jgi:hypothetical protein